MLRAAEREQPVVCETLEDVSRQLDRIFSHRRAGVRLIYPANSVIISGSRTTSGRNAPFTPGPESDRERIMGQARAYGLPATSDSSSTAEPEQRTSEKAGRQLGSRTDDSSMSDAGATSSSNSSCGEPPEKVQRLTSPAGEAEEQIMGVVACSTLATVSAQQVAACLRELSGLRQLVEHQHKQKEQLEQKLAEQQQQHADALAQLKQQNADALAQLQQQCAEQLAKFQQQIAGLLQQIMRMQQQKEQQVARVQQGVAAAAPCVVACPPAAPVPHADAGNESEPSTAAVPTVKHSEPAPQAQLQQKRPASALSYKAAVQGADAGYVSEPSAAAASTVKHSKPAPQAQLQQKRPASTLSYKAAVQGAGEQQQDAPMADVQSLAAPVAQQQQRPTPPPAFHKAAGEGMGKQQHGAARPRAPGSRGQPSADLITFGKSFYLKGKLGGLLERGGDMREAVVEFLGEMMPAGRPWGVSDAVRRGPTAFPTILITVGTLGEADRLIQHRHQLKGSGVTLYEVLSPEEQRQHKALWPAFVAARRQGKRAQFRRAVLIVEGVRVKPAAT